MNNRVENLAWGTKKENTADRVAQGTQRYGELVSTHKLTDEAVIEIKELLRNGKTQVEIAHMFGVTRRVIGRILHGQSWKHVG